MVIGALGRESRSTLTDNMDKSSPGTKVTARQLQLSSFIVKKNKPSARVYWLIFTPLTNLSPHVLVLGQESSIGCLSPARLRVLCQ